MTDDIADKFSISHSQHVESGGRVAARRAEGLLGDPAGDADLVKDVAAGLEHRQGVGHHVDLHQADRAVVDGGGRSRCSLGGELPIDLKKTITLFAL